MTEHKFTDDEIIRALKCCVHNREFRYCDERKCPLFNVGVTYSECKEFLVKEIIDRYDRQKAEIERLHNILLSFTNEVHTWSNKNGYDTTGLSLIPILNEAESVRETIKAEAIKEFAERLEEKAYPDDSICTQFVVNVEDIKDLVKEMTEEETKI